MVIAHHLILTGYGQWLPNDPRGSMSRRVWSPSLRELAEPHYGRRQEQPSIPELRAFHQRAADRLAYPVLWFNTATRQAIAVAFEHVVAENNYTCFACAIVSNHAHVIIRKHRDKAEQMLEALMCESARRVRLFEAVPHDHPVWCDDRRIEFVKTVDHLRQAIRYVNNNFAKSKLPPQDYPFITPYTGEWSGRRSGK